jgi:Domain of unknown function (DUF5916)/Carbohydrate family 9 binding domain-like
LRTDPELSPGLGPVRTRRPSPTLLLALALLLALTLLPALTSPLQAQQAGRRGQQPRQEAAAKTLSAQRALGDIVLDGIVSDDEWAGAAIASDFIQYEPRRADPATRATEAFFLYDSETIYIAFRVEDDEPPTAQLTRRDDDIMSDDAVVIILDTFHDRQSAYLIGTNALGTQADGRAVNDGRTIDFTWDGVWSVAVARDGNSWSAEFAIPLSSLQFTSGEDVVWGVNFMRSRSRNLEVSAWAGPLDAQFRISQAGTVTGLDVAAPLDRLQVIPYAQSVFEDGESPAWRAGGDVRYAVTSTSLVNATINPDFALIEADQEEINLSRFELRLPEKRPFFLEGDEYFRQRIRTFYSRRVADITAGGKVLGRQGDWTTAAIYSRATPANAGDGDPDGDPDGDFGVVRLQRSLGRSNIGFIGAARRLDSETLGSIGLDATLFFSPSLGMTAQLVQSAGPGDPADPDGGTLGFFVRPSYDTPTAHFHVRYTHLGSSFADNVNAIGFVRDDNRRELDSALSRTFWLERGPFERIEYDSNYNAFWAANASDLRSWEVVQGLETDLRNLVSLEFDWTEEYIEFEKPFRNRRLSFGAGYNTRTFEQVSVGYEFGRNFDADFDLWTAAAAYKLTEQLSAEYELQRLELTPDPEGENTWIHVLRGEQFFTPDLFLRVFLQTNSAIDRRNVQVTFVYRYLPPFGTIQLAYQRGTAAFGEISDQGDTLFLKVTTVF